MRFSMLWRAALAMSLSTCALDNTGPSDCSAAEKVNNAPGCSETRIDSAPATEAWAESPA